MTQVQLDADGTLSLAGEVNISNAASIHAELAAILEHAPDELVIDMSQVTELDTAGLQLLLSLRLTVENTRVHSCPAHLRDFIEHVGLTRVLT
jgi:anti-anti-sigma factor